MAPPYSNPLRRAVTITMALARLGERGLPADAVMRTCLGPRLARHILVTASTLWCGEKQSQVRRDRLQPEIIPWLELIDRTAKVPKGEMGLAPVTAATLAGEPMAVAREWVDTAAVAHLVGWRLDGYLRVARGPDDCLLSGGRSATIWVFDRFTETFLDAWSPSSLDWELAYAQQPAGVAARIGLSQSMLSERPTSVGLVQEEVARRLVSPSARRSPDSEASEYEVIEGLVALLHASEFEAARSVARQAYEESTSVFALKLAYAFCSLPLDPAGAREVLASLRPENEQQAALSAVNRATSHLFDGHLDQAAETIEEVNAELASLTEAWLWDPAEAACGCARLRYGLVQDWLEDLRKIDGAMISQRTVGAP